MKRPTWKVIRRGAVPLEGAKVAQFTCLNCMHEADLPILGTAIAQVGDGIIFDPGPHAMPAVIECRKCGRQMEWGE